MTGIEPGSSGIESDRSANCATTTWPKILVLGIFEGHCHENCPHYDFCAVIYNLKMFLDSQNVFCFLASTTIKSQIKIVKCLL